jgi:hypothetical protein
MLARIGAVSADIADLDARIGTEIESFAINVYACRL